MAQSVNQLADVQWCSVYRRERCAQLLPPSALGRGETLVPALSKLCRGAVLTAAKIHPNYSNRASYRMSFLAAVLVLALNYGSPLIFHPLPRLL